MVPGQEPAWDPGSRALPCRAEGIHVCEPRSLRCWVAGGVGLTCRCGGRGSGEGHLRPRLRGDRDTGQGGGEGTKARSRRGPSAGAAVTGPLTWDLNEGFIPPGSGSRCGQTTLPPDSRGGSFLPLRPSGRSRLCLCPHSLLFCLLRGNHPWIWGPPHIQHDLSWFLTFHTSEKTLFPSKVTGSGPLLSPSREREPRLHRGAWLWGWVPGMDKSIIHGGRGAGEGGGTAPADARGSLPAGEAGLRASSVGSEGRG